VEKPLHSEKVTVWIGFTRNFICPPFLFPCGQTIDGANYKQLLEEYALPFLKKKRMMRKVVFMHDGAPPHFSRVVRNFLETTFKSRIIGRGFNWFWPPRSPDITPCDFWFWGYVKHQVYRRQPQTLDELQQAIREEIHAIDVKMLEKVVDSVPRRMHGLIERKGAHIL
jgi:hypothetical protein